MDKTSSKAECSFPASDLDVFDFTNFFWKILVNGLVNLSPSSVSTQIYKDCGGGGEVGWCLQISNNSDFFTKFKRLNFESRKAHTSKLVRLGFTWKVLYREVKGDSKLISKVSKARSCTFEIKIQLFVMRTEVSTFHLKIRKNFW